MEQISQFYQQSQFSLAAYADFSTGSENDALINAGMTSDQAIQFLDQYTLIDQFNDGSGFSATIFKDQNGKRYLAIRGTEDILDFIADAYILAGWPSILNPQFITLRTQVQLWMDTGVLPSSYTITGHSLGGYLAAAIGSWFSVNNEGTYLVNAPGVGGIVGNVVDIFKEVVGLGDIELTSNIYNLRASSGLSLIAGLGTQLASPIYIETEFNANPFTNHSILTINDSLAVYDLLANIDNGINIEIVSNILKASSIEDNNTLERAINSIGDLFNAGNFVNLNNREELHLRIQSIFETVTVQTFELQSLVNKSAIELKVKALGFSLENPDDAIAYRYALRELNPFVITGNAGLYSQHNQDGELILENFSEKYLNDASEFLVLKNELGSKDKTFKSGNNLFTNVYQKNDDSGAQELELRLLNIGPGGPRERYITFGGQGAIIGDRPRFFD